MEQGSLISKIDHVRLLVEYFSSKAANDLILEKILNLLERNFNQL